MSETASPVRRGRRLRTAVAFAVLLALIGYVVVQYVTGGDAPRCTVRAAGGEDGDEGPTYEFSAEQAANAATISAVGTTRGMPERAVTIALATALQESGLRNIGHGDRDSLGLFQQRPSKGWGTQKEILDPVYASGKFYEYLAEVPGYSRLPLTVAAQRVQRSGFPQAYAKHEPNATLLAAALTGRASATLTCESREGGTAGDPAKVRAELVRAFGPGVLPKGGAGSRAGAPGPRELSVPVRTTLGTAAGADGGTTDRTDGGTSDRTSDRTSYRADIGTGAGTARGGASRRGWELAHWAVARAEDLRIEQVSFGGRVWSAKESGKGWRPTRAATGSGPTEVRIRIAQ
ncbi:hypothetical protein OG883_04570 [Streptomyces sp. NBC_01142]|uniref:hypothetical protein n=1 Tax=Streptomyces sp. NBC_01142 TaxID=2975865 RepID=UPI002255FE40|nr:hypothetical protein [Streptomyces sp. NBC_01142]MCX4819188.1 hypothetical protein [Streptomyces sp. NBC_01142]